MRQRHIRDFVEPHCRAALTSAVSTPCRVSNSERSYGRLVDRRVKSFPLHSCTSYMRRPLTTHTYTRHTKHSHAPFHTTDVLTLQNESCIDSAHNSARRRPLPLLSPGALLCSRPCSCVPFRCTRRALCCSDLRRDQLRPRRPFGQGRWRGRGRRSYQSTCARFGHRWCYRLMLLRRFCALSRDLINLPQAAERVRGFECLQLVAALALVHVCPGALNGARAHAAGAAPAS